MKEIQTDPKVIGIIDSGSKTYFCYDESFTSRVAELISSNYEGEYSLAENDDIKNKADYFLLDLPEDNWVIFPVSRKPHGWTWQQLMQVVNATRLLPVTQPNNEYDSVKIFRKYADYTV